MRSLIKGSSINQLRTSKYLASLPDLKTEKNKRYLAIILTLSASIFFALFAINPTLSTITKLKREIEDSRLVEKKLSNKIANLSTLSQQYELVKEDEVYITDAIPQKPDATELTGQVQSIAKKNNILINELRVSPLILTNVASKDGELTFNLTARGDYSSLVSFLKGLTNMQRVISIESLTLTQSEASQVSIKGIGYFKK